MGQVSRMRLDMALAVGLVGCMAYPLIGGAWHEWLGTAVLAGVLWHLGRNAGWFRALRRGCWRAPRILSTLLDGALCFVTLGLIVSSLMLSVHVFAFLPLDLPAGVGLTPHQVCAFWGFLLAALHLGQHGPMLRHTLAAQGLQPGRAVLALILAGGGVAFLLEGYGARLFLMTRAPLAGGWLVLAGNALLFAGVVTLGMGLRQLAAGAGKENG